MEMKLNSKRIRELRLERSWTQEQLADKARLNARTIQRVELDGQGSLRTRAQLAMALGVSPGELDVAGDEAAQVAAIQAGGWRGAVQDYMNAMSLQAFALQLLVTLFFLGSLPIYQSAARNGFYINLIGWVPRDPWPHSLAWWLLNLALWTLLSAPALAWVWKRQRQWFWLACAAALVTLFLSVLRLWQAPLVAEVTLQAVFYAGLILLVCQWLPRVSRVQAEHLLYACLYAYVYLWCFQVLVYWGALFVWYPASEPFEDDRLAPFKALGGRLTGLTELLPVVCVWLLGRGQRRAGGASGMASANGQPPDESSGKDGAGSFFGQQALEN